LIVPCRGMAEGGGFIDSPEHQVAVLQRALASGPAYLDVELSVPAQLRQQLYASRGPTRLIASYHHFGPEPLRPITMELLTEAPGDLVKFAIKVDDATDLDDLLAMLPDETRPVIRIGMGPAGLLSRWLYGRFGSPWTYVAATPDRTVAPGQLDLDQVSRWRLADVADSTLLALMGGPHIVHSPGPDCYNRLFGQRGLPFIYLSCLTDDPPAALALLERLGCGGCSVTMPAKRILMDAMDSVSDLARRAGALNTVLWRAGRRHGENSDAAAIRQLVGESESPPARTLILGGGGTARAALAVSTGEVFLAGRSLDKIATLADEFGAIPVAWSNRAAVPFDLLINATPVGMDGEADPLPPRVDLTGKTVLDAVYTPGGSPLVRRARAAGATVHDGFTLWCEQGARQISAMIGQPVTPTQLREVHDA
ncbi:MAG: type I 3-dehydroquinate dehydratase, partial [bacterium]